MLREKRGKKTKRAETEQEKKTEKAASLIVLCVIFRDQKKT